MAEQGLLRPGMSVVVSVNTKAPPNGAAACRGAGDRYRCALRLEAGESEVQAMASHLPLTAGRAAPAMPIAPADRIEPRRLFAFLAMVFGMFMAILDIQIVSASLTEIQAGLAASANEISWVQTAYLIAEVVMIPLSGFLSRALGTRILFAVSAAGFTAASLMCGLSTSINEMIVWRAMQGFIGGGMIPTVFATAYTIFPRSRMGLIAPLIGLVATLAPTIGPTVGGYLTDALSWHWLFFINVVPGIVVTVAALTADRFRQAGLRCSSIRLVGLLSMARLPRRLEYVLEEGPRNDWFGDDTVLLLAGSRACRRSRSSPACSRREQPIVDLRAFADRNFALGSLFSFVLGIGLYGLTYLYPLYLAEVRGYDALMIGETMFVSGLAMFVTAPIAGRLMRKVDPRIMLMFGFLCFAVGHLVDDLSDQGLGFLGAALAADVPRRRADDRDDPDQQHRARHAAAGAGEERLRPLQSDAQSRRRGWARRPHDDPQRPHRPAPRAPARDGDLVAPSALEALNNLTTRFQSYGSDAQGDGAQAAHA